MLIHQTWLRTRRSTVSGQSSVVNSNADDTHSCWNPISQFSRSAWRKAAYGNESVASVQQCTRNTVQPARPARPPTWQTDQAPSTTTHEYTTRLDARIHTTVCITGQSVCDASMVSTICCCACRARYTCFSMTVFDLQGCGTWEAHSRLLS